jgi:hypothetical protein
VAASHSENTSPLSVFLGAKNAKECIEIRLQKTRQTRLTNWKLWGAIAKAAMIERYPVAN